MDGPVADTLVRLTKDRVIARPKNDTRPTARGRVRPRTRRPVADQISDQRR